MSTVEPPPDSDQLPPRDFPYCAGFARARRELISGQVSTDVAVALLALLAALDVAAEQPNPVDLPARHRREMTALAVDLPGADR